MAIPTHEESGGVIFDIKISWKVSKVCKSAIETYNLPFSSYSAILLDTLEAPRDHVNVYMRAMRVNIDIYPPENQTRNLTGLSSMF